MTGLGRGDMNRTRSVWKWLALVLALALLGAACGDDDGSAAGGSAGDKATKEGPRIRVRGQDFSENITLAEVYGQYLTAKGFDVEVLTPAGFRTEALDALQSGDVDLVIDYIGGDQTALAPDTTTSTDPKEVVAVITPLLAKKGITLLDPSEAANGDALVVRGDSKAEKISDLAGMDYRFGAAAECYERPQCYLGFTDPKVYGIKFAATKTYEFGPILGESLAAKEVDAVMWGTTAPEIKEQGFKILTDDKHLFPAQNIAPLVRTEVLDAYGNDLRDALDELSRKITTADLVAWNKATDIDKLESDDVAKDWLQEKGLL